MKRLEDTVRRSPTPLRALLVTAVGAVTLAALTGCFAPPVVVETPRPTPTGFGSIGGEADPIETGDPVVPTAAPEAGYTTLTDDLAVLSIQVPASWTDVDGSPFTTDGGTEWAAITASPDLESYYATWTTPGVEFAATPIDEAVDEATLVGFLQSVGEAHANSCVAVEVEQPYDDGFYVGVYSSFEDCGGDGGAQGFVIVAQDPSYAHAVYVRGQLISEQDQTDTLGVILATFQASI